LGELVEVGDRHVLQLRLRRRAGVGRGDEDRLDQRRLRQPPGTLALASAAAEHEHFHGIPALWKPAWVWSSSSSTSRSFCIRAASSPSSGTVFSGRIVTSASSGFIPAARSAGCTASKPALLESTSIAPSASAITSSAPASSAISITLSSLVPGANTNWPHSL